MKSVSFLPLLGLFLWMSGEACSQTLKLKEQRGNASYYADRFHGRTMSNGERYHRDSMTCAHLTYPLGTVLRVTNLTNGKEVIVRVTDRGPYTRKFVIDLSRAAARELDIIQWGYRPVSIVPYKPFQIPYKYIAPTERPELDLGYSAEDMDEPPVWMDDSIYQSRHLLSRTRILHVEPDSLRSTLDKDTTLRQAVHKVVIKNVKKGGNR